MACLRIPGTGRGTRRGYAPALSVAGLGLFAALAAPAATAGQPIEDRVLGAGPAPLQRVALGAGDDYFTLEKGAAVIERRAVSDGRVVARYDTGSMEGFETASTLDFDVDRSDRVHALLYWVGPGPRDRTCAVRRFDDPETFEHVFFEKRVDGNRLSLDGDGNYYVLGVESELLEEAERALYFGRPLPEATMHLVHKFGPGGKWLGSFAPRPFPVEAEALRAFESYFPSMSDLVATRDGEAYLLFRTPPRLDEARLLSPLEVDEQLFRIFEGGSLGSVPAPAPAPFSSIRRLLRGDDDGLALEWTVFESAPPRASAMPHVTRRVLSLLVDGREIDSFPVSGQVMDLRDDRVVEYSYDSRPGMGGVSLVLKRRSVQSR